YISSRRTAIRWDFLEMPVIVMLREIVIPYSSESISPDKMLLIDKSRYEYFPNRGMTIGVDLPISPRINAPDIVEVPDICSSVCVDEMLFTLRDDLPI